ncbi:izumo sperm-egg fusion protein 2 [Ornithorhynchus anatinus]|uniref:izumo sperm-egg fusion protein 2 n=1 Tax=Ornithorhynchus anatinus TaxID=9258 RepID=UPI0019D46D36|nr:izumo sperm-egg fusion protein 2 [Ornithorhynchus anatinus]
MPRATPVTSPWSPRAPRSPAMPLPTSGPLWGPLPLLLLLLASFPKVPGCLHCNAPLRQALAALRARLIPSHFQSPRLRARAGALLDGMAGGFYRDYATYQYAGQVGVTRFSLVQNLARNKTEELMRTTLTEGPLLDRLVEVRAEVAQALKRSLKEHQNRACDPNYCSQLSFQVLDCLRCKTEKADCLSRRLCFGDRQPRLVLRYGPQGVPIKDRAAKGRVMVLTLAGITFGVVVAAALTYRSNRRLLRTPRKNNANSHQSSS